MGVPGRPRGRFATGGAYRGMGDAFVRMAREEGVMSFFKGLKASLLGLSHIMIQFPLYENFKERARRRARDRRGEDELQMVEIMAAAMGAKAIASTLTYPHEVLRARLQYQVTPAAGAASGGGAALYFVQ